MTEGGLYFQETSIFELAYLLYPSLRGSYPVIRLMADVADEEKSLDKFFKQFPFAERINPENLNSEHKCREDCFSENYPLMFRQIADAVMRQNKEHYLFWQQELRMLNFEYLGYEKDTEQDILGVELAGGEHFMISYHFDTKKLYLPSEYRHRQAQRLESTARQFVLSLSKYAGIVYLGSTNWKDRPYEAIDELAKLTEILKQGASSFQEILDTLEGAFFLDLVWLAVFNKEILNRHSYAPLILKAVKEIEKKEKNSIQIEEIGDVLLVSIHPQHAYAPVFWWQAED
jgi:hypothetical protein